MLGAIGLLLTAICVEVITTVNLPRTEGFRNPLWVCVILSGYAISIGLLAIVVERIPVSTAYAVWSGLGTASVAAIGATWLGESWNVTKVLALAMVVVGVVVLNLQASH